MIRDDSTKILVKYDKKRDARKQALALKMLQNADFDAFMLQNVRK
jgi:hypothetical protein